MKLTLAIAVVAMVLVAGTTTICLSGAVNENTIEYGSGLALATYGCSIPIC